MTALGLAIGSASILAAVLETRNLFRGGAHGQDFYVLIASVGGTAWFAARLLGWQ